MILKKCHVMREAYIYNTLHFKKAVPDCYRMEMMLYA